MRDAFFATLILYTCAMFPACALDSRPHVGAIAGPICSGSAAGCDSSMPVGASGMTGSAGKSGQGSAADSGIAVAGTVAMMSGGMGGTVVSGTGGVSAAGGTGGTGGTTPPPPLRDPGVACTADTQCATGHCDGVCCSSGDCCLKVTDCKMTTANGQDLACNDPTICSGSGGKVECNTDFRCVATGGAANDSACGLDTLANNCGLYPPVYCNGAVTQSAPVCATTCTTDTDCDAVAHCDNRSCVMDVPNGSLCTRNTDCESNHCSGGFCCGSGDCCPQALGALGASVCPGSYSADATCDPKTCQGTSRMATCVNSQCGTMTVEDDTSCTNTTVVNDCGPFSNVVCSGAANQATPAGCFTTCNNNNSSVRCDMTAYCRNNQCMPKVPDRGACDASNNCASNFCGPNHLCCNDTGGECCNTVADCDASFSITMCTNPATCTGVANTAVCQGGACVAMPGVACAGVTNNCSPYANPASAACPARCKTSCSGNSDCATGFMCNGGERCVPMMGMAGSGGGGTGGN